jgi:hypothetical protein
VSRRAQGVGLQPAAQLAASRAGLCPVPHGDRRSLDPDQERRPWTRDRSPPRPEPADKKVPSHVAGHRKAKGTLVPDEDGGGSEIVGLVGPGMVLPRS